MAKFTEVTCGRCGHVIGKERDGKLKVEVRSRLIAISKGGDVEMNCPNCKSVVHLPLLYLGGK